MWAVSRQRSVRKLQYRITTTSLNLCSPVPTRKHQRFITQKPSTIRHSQSHAQITTILEARVEQLTPTCGLILVPRTLWTRGEACPRTWRSGKPTTCAGCMSLFCHRDKPLMRTFRMTGFHLGTGCPCLDRPHTTPPVTPLPHSNCFQSCPCGQILHGKDVWSNWFLQGELGHPGDPWLLQLERARLLDMAHSWSTGTFPGY